MPADSSTPARREAAAPATMTAAQRRDAEAQHAANDLVRSVRDPVFREQVADALPENVPASRFVRATATALLANPELALLDHTKMLRELLKCASDGLVPDGRQAAIVDRKGSPVYTPMIGGYRKIAAEHGWTLEARVVHERDDFDYALGDTPTVTHRPHLGGDRGEVTHAYAIGRHRSGEYAPVIEVLPRVEIDKRRRAATTDRVWSQWFERMAEKTAGKAVFARLPLDPTDMRVRRMIDADALDDGEAAGRMYGQPQPRRIADAQPVRTQAAPAAQLSPPPDTAAGRDDREHDGADGQQAADDVGDQREHADASAVPDDEPAVDVPAEAPAGPTLEQARAFKFESGPNEGKTLGQIADADGALTYFTWALGKIAAGELVGPSADAITVVAREQVPDAWAQHTKGGTQ